MTVEALVVVNQLGERVRDVLASFGPRLHVVDAAYDTATPWEYANLARAADVLITGPSRGWKQAPDKAPSGWAARGEGPRWVQIVSAGVDGFPQWLLRNRIVTCGRGDAAEPIAEYVLGVLLLHAKRFDTLHPKSHEDWVTHGEAIRTGRAPLLGGLAGRTLGIAGFGAIGRAVAVRARAFGLNVMAWRRGAWDVQDRALVEPAGTLGELAARSDHLLLALPLTPETRRIVDAEILAQARPGLHLINVARGGLIDQDALVAALDDGHLGFATLDVTEPEPLPRGHVLYTHPRVRLTPHISWSGPDVRGKSAERVAENVERFLSGHTLRDVVDAQRGY